jgi:hypothetical protein
MKHEEIKTEIVEALAEMISERANKLIRVTYSKMSRNDPQFNSIREYFINFETNKLARILDKLMDDIE